MTEELQIDYRELQKAVEELLPGAFPFTFEELVERLVKGETNQFGEIMKDM